MDQEPINYPISPTEIWRRQNAYATLMISLSVSLSFTLWIWFKSYSVLLYMLPIVLLFFLSIMIFMKFFRNYAKTKITLHDEFIERSGYKATDKIFFTDIKSLAVLYTIRGLIRNIVIGGKNKTLVLDGLENFQQFKSDLVAKNPNVPVKESKEPFDFDHPYFYAILGIIVGFILPCAIIYLARSNINWVILAISIYAIIVGLFFLINRPIAKRYGDKKPAADIIFGIILVFAGYAIYLMSN